MPTECRRAGGKQPGGLGAGRDPFGGGEFFKHQPRGVVAAGLEQIPAERERGFGGGRCGRIGVDDRLRGGDGRGGVLGKVRDAKAGQGDAAGPGSVPVPPYSVSNWARGEREIGRGAGECGFRRGQAGFGGSRMVRVFG